MAYKRREMPWGEQNYEIDPNPVYGQIKRGPLPAQNRFQGPRIGLQPNYTGANRPLIDNTAPAGTYTSMINQGAQSYVDFKQDQKNTLMRKSMKLARANNKVQALRTAKAFGLGPTGPAVTGLAPPAGTTWGPPSTRTRPPRTTLPPPAGTTPAPPTGGATPPPFPPATPPVGGPTPPWTGTPPKPPRTKKGIGTTDTPFDLPPLAEAGMDFITASIRTMRGDDTTPAPSSVEWKDDPENPFPMGPVKSFDTSRMFDPTYKSSEESMPSAKSRTKKRPPK
jgi:hypothetical protein